MTVPGENLLGEVDSGFIYMMERLPRNGLAARSATSPTQSRPSSKPSNTPRSAKPSAKPIGSFQHLKFILAEQATKLDVTQSFMDECVMAKINGTFSATDAAKAKWWTSQIRTKLSMPAFRSLAATAT